MTNDYEENATSELNCFEAHEYQEPRDPNPIWWIALVSIVLLILSCLSSCVTTNAAPRTWKTTQTYPK